MVARGGHGAHPGHPQTVLEGSRNYGLRLVVAPESIVGFEEISDVSRSVQ